MKKKKIAGLALAATLLVGGTFAGTKALFTDKVDPVGELSISTGDVDIEVLGNPEWKLERNGEEGRVISPGGEITKFDNLKRGDILTKTVEIYNNGTLKALVELKENKEITSKLPEGIEYTAKLNGEQITDEKEIELGAAANKKATIEFTIEVTGGGQHNAVDSLNSDEQEMKIIDLKDSYTLNATQQNPKHLK